MVNIWEQVDRIMGDCCVAVYGLSRDDDDDDDDDDDTRIVQRISLHFRS